MKQRLFIFLFFTGFVPLVLSDPPIYYLIQEGKTWSDAQAYCRARYSDLAIIETNNNLVRLQNETQNFTSSAWIGLYNAVNSWHWSMGNESLGNVTFWKGGEPNNFYGMESCGTISSWGWNDMPCSDLISFVCFDGTKTGNGRYIYISTAMSWTAAQNYCRTYHTDLASSKNATENSIILGLTSWSWFGLARYAWKWTNQRNFSILSWLPGKPNNAQGDNNCGYLNNGQVGDASCSSIMPFYCYLKRKRYFVKMKVQSNQDVNDPTAKQAILEQINQKLKDRGMAEGSTVKWKEHPDGVVFRKKNKNPAGQDEL